MKELIILSIFFLVFNLSFGQDTRIPVRLDAPGEQFKLVGKLGEAMGDTVTVRGFIFDEFRKGHDMGLKLAVQMIRDSAIQNQVLIHLWPYEGKFGKPYIVGPAKLPKLEEGATYRFRVYETGEYVGRPYLAWKEWYRPGEAIAQSRPHAFRTKLIVFFAEKIEPIDWSPGHFLEKNALLSGTALNDNDTAVIRTSKWTLKLLGLPKWTDSEIGKNAEAYGVVRETKTNGIYTIENGWARLTSLKDQLGKIVKLRGTAWNRNGIWWFNYRGTDIYVENMDQLPGWISKNYGRSIEITGILKQEKLPRLDQIYEDDPGLRLQYIVRNASWAPVKELLTPEIDFER